MSKGVAINQSKGYRIHFNALAHSELLPTFAEFYKGTPLAKSRWYPNDPDLKDREILTAHNLDEFLGVMQNADQERLADSKVIYGVQMFDWKKFFVDGEVGLRNLYNRVSGMGKTNIIPCAITFEVSHDKTLREYGSKWVKGQSFLGRGKIIETELYLSYLQNSGLQDVYVHEGDLLLATGIAQRSFVSKNRETIRVYVNGPDDMRRIRREELTTPPPPQEPYVPSNEVPPGLFPLHGE